jgi:hypothetical protein
MCSRGQLSVMSPRSTHPRMSSWRKNYGREMDLLEALEDTVGGGMGTIISCVPGELAYFESEEQGERYICHRTRQR